MSSKRSPKPNSPLTRKPYPKTRDAWARRLFNVKRFSQLLLFEQRKVDANLGAAMDRKPLPFPFPLIPERATQILSPSRPPRLTKKNNPAFAKPVALEAESRTKGNVRDDFSYEIFGKRFEDLETDERNAIKAITLSYAYGMSIELMRRVAL